MSLAEPKPGRVAPWLQANWDLRAAGNFIGGGSGTGLLIAGACAWAGGGGYRAFAVVGLALVALAALPYLDSDMDSVGVYFRSRRGRWLAAFSAAAGVLLTVGYVLADEFYLDLPAWLPSLPTLFSNGLVPLAALVLGLIGYAEAIRRWFRATKCETTLSLFVLVLAGFLVLTLIGIFFRGPGMALMWPWEVAAGH